MKRRASFYERIDVVRKSSARIKSSGRLSAFRAIRGGSLLSLFSLSPASVYIGISAHSIMGIIKEMGWVPVGSPRVLFAGARNDVEREKIVRGREKLERTSLRWWRRFRRVRFIGRLGRKGCVDAGRLFHDFIYSIFLGDTEARFPLHPIPGTFNGQPAR